MVLRDVVVVGAGPAGLATAIAASKSGLSCQVIEKGALVNSLLHYPTEMVFFTTPELMEIGGMPFVSPYDKPTRLEALRYYRRVSDAYQAGYRVRRSGRRDDARRVIVGRFRDVRRRHAFGPRCAPLRPRPDGRHRDGGVRCPQPHRRAGRGPAARVPLLHAAASVLPQESRHRRRQELRGRGRARPLPRRGQGHDCAPSRSDGRFDQVLGQARYRQSHQGRVDSRALQHQRRRDPARRASWWNAPGSWTRSTPTPCSC